MAAINSSPPESSTPPTTNSLPSGENIVGTVFQSTVSSSVQLVQPMNQLVTMKLEDGNFLT